MKRSARSISSARLLVAPALGAGGDELLVPLVDPAEVGEAALGEGPQQVQRGRRLVVGLQQALRAGDRAAAVEGDVVDHVAAEAGELHAVDGLGVGRSGAWRTVRRCGRPSPRAPRRSRSARPPSAGSPCRRSRIESAENASKDSAQSPACSRKASPSATRPRSAVSARASPANTSGGIAREVLERRVELGGVGPVGLLRAPCRARHEPGVQRGGRCRWGVGVGHRPQATRASAAGPKSVIRRRAAGSESTGCGRHRRPVAHGARRHA